MTNKEEGVKPATSAGKLSHLSYSSKNIGTAANKSKDDKKTFIDTFSERFYKPFAELDNYEKDLLVKILAEFEIADATTNLDKKDHIIRQLQVGDLVGALRSPETSLMQRENVEESTPDEKTKETVDPRPSGQSGGFGTGGFGEGREEWDENAQAGDKTVHAASPSEAKAEVGDVDIKITKEAKADLRADSAMRAATSEPRGPEPKGPTDNEKLREAVLTIRGESMGRIEVLLDDVRYALENKSNSATQDLDNVTFEASRKQLVILQTVLRSALTLHEMEDIPPEIAGDLAESANRFANVIEAIEKMPAYKAAKFAVDTAATVKGLRELAFSLGGYAAKAFIG